ncbi:hypothetical protein AOLI_G00157090 [Acnodon oligacanthus]
MRTDLNDSQPAGACYRNLLSSSPVELTARLTLYHHHHHHHQWTTFPKKLSPQCCRRRDTDLLLGSSSLMRPAQEYTGEMKVI